MNRRETLMSKRRYAAYQAVKFALISGFLPPVHFLKCFDCGRQAQCYDHRDYRKPLDVWPVCKSCDAKRGACEPYDGAEFFWNQRMLQTKKRLRKQHREWLASQRAQALGERTCT